jgi:hypothetical protein
MNEKKKKMNENDHERIVSLRETGLGPKRHNHEEGRATQQTVCYLPMSKCVMNHVIPDYDGVASIL